MGIMEKVPVKIFYKELFFVFKRIFETSAGDLPYSVKLITQPDSSSDDYSFSLCYILIAFKHLQSI